MKKKRSEFGDNNQNRFFFVQFYKLSKHQAPPLVFNSIKAYCGRYRFYDFLFSLRNETPANDICQISYGKFFEVGI